MTPEQEANLAQRAVQLLNCLLSEEGCYIVERDEESVTVSMPDHLWDDIVDWADEQETK